MSGNIDRITIGAGPVEDYIYRVVELANKGAEKLVLYAVGENICKLVDTIALLPNYIPGKVKIVGWSINNRRVKGERKTTLSIEIVIEYL